VHRRDLALLLSLAAIWGASFLFIKLGVEEVEPAVVVLGRLLVGFAVLVPVVVARGAFPDVRRMWVPFLVLGTLNNAVPYWLLAFAETRIDSGLAAVIQAAAPILTVVLATRIDPRARPGGLRLVGVGISFVGVALLVGVRVGSSSALAVLGTATCVSVLPPGRAIRSFAPLEVTIGQLAVGTLLAAPVALTAAVGGAREAVAASRSGRSAGGVPLYFTLIARAGSRAILVTYLVPRIRPRLRDADPRRAGDRVGRRRASLILGGTALGTKAQPATWVAWRGVSRSGPASCRRRERRERLHPACDARRRRVLTQLATDDVARPLAAVRASTPEAIADRIARADADRTTRRAGDQVDGGAREPSRGSSSTAARGSRR
jgi:drug/metabolite transporter (DMT)-like permease